MRKYNSDIENGENAKVILLKVWNCSFTLSETDVGKLSEHAPEFIHFYLLIKHLSAPVSN